jgi:plastocyanin
MLYHLLEDRWMLQTDAARPARAPLAIAMTAGLLLLAACGSGASPSGAATQSDAGTAERCSVSADATAADTIELAGFAFSGEATVSAGESVSFTNNDSAGHTITEGTGGTAADEACVDESIAAGATVTVTFTEPGDYQVTCKIHPAMQTVVHVE